MGDKGGKKGEEEGWDRVKEKKRMRERKIPFFSLFPPSLLLITQRMRQQEEI